MPDARDDRSHRTEGGTRVWLTRMTCPQPQGPPQVSLQGGHETGGPRGEDPVRDDQGGEREAGQDRAGVQAGFQDDGDQHQEDTMRKLFCHLIV